MWVDHDDLSNYYKTNLALVSEHGFSLSEIEYMIPFERMIYIDLIAAKVKEAVQDAKEKAIWENDMKEFMMRKQKQDHQAAQRKANRKK